MRALLLLFASLALATGCSASRARAPAGPMLERAVVTSSVSDDARGGVQGERVAAQQIDQKLVRTAYLTVEVPDDEDLEPAVKKAEQVAGSLQGYVANQTERSIVFKVPAARLDEALDAIAGLGEVTDRNISVVDVTAEYVDLEIRIENLEKVRARLQQLVEQSTAVSDILAVEKELARVTAELESLKGRMRLMENQTSYATVSIGCEERVMPGPVGWVFSGTYRAVKWLFVWD